MSFPLVPQLVVKVPVEPESPFAGSPFPLTPFGPPFGWTWVMSWKSAATGPLPTWPCRPGPGRRALVLAALVLRPGPALVLAIALVLTAGPGPGRLVLALVPAVVDLVGRHTLALGELLGSLRRLTARVPDVDVDPVDGGRPLGLQRAEDGVVDVAGVTRLGLARVRETLVGLRDLLVELRQLLVDTLAGAVRHIGQLSGRRPGI